MKISPHWKSNSEYFQVVRCPSTILLDHCAYGMVKVISQNLYLLISRQSSLKLGKLEICLTSILTLCETPMSLCIPLYVMGFRVKPCLPIIKKKPVKCTTIHLELFYTIFRCDMVFLLLKFKHHLSFFWELSHRNCLW